jgi:Transposase DDE domain
MLSMTAALARIKGRVADAVPPELIQRLSRAVGHTWRERDLGPGVATHLFLQQVLHGNVAVGELRRLSGLSFTDAAYCQARARLPRALLERLQQSVSETLFDTTAVRPTELWHGHRVFLLDGSSFSMPDTPELQARFGQPGGQAEGCGFPVAHLMTRFDAATGLLLRTAALPLRSHDLSGVPAMHTDLRRGDVLVGDRAFGSYAHLALCQKRGVHGVFRAHQKQIINFRPHRRHATAQSRKEGQTGLPSARWLKRLGKHDQLVEYFKPKERPSWLTEEEYAALPATLVVREVRYAIKGRKRRTRVVTLVTTLVDPEQYPAKDLAKLYGLRWAVETNLKHLKQTLHLDVLRCRTVEGVLKELTLLVLIYNLVRRVMWEAARRQEVAVERISFMDAWRWLRHARPGDALPALVVNPERPSRAEPRVRKRRPKEFPLMKRPRAVLRKELLTKKDAA